MIEMILGNIHLDRDQAYPEMKEGEYLYLSTKDSGCGMTEDIMRHIFEPFFTTKEIGKGTGMGLSVIHGIVKSHGGIITVESDYGRGSQFTVYLPLMAGGIQVEDQGTDD
jgi:signal transduction histidine kinase